MEINLTSGPKIGEYYILLTMANIIINYFNLLCVAFVEECFTIVVNGLPFFCTNHIRFQFRYGWHAFPCKRIRIQQLKDPTEVVAFPSVGCC